MEILLSNAGPIAHMASNKPITGHITEISEYVFEPGMAILVNNGRISRIDQSEILLEEHNDCEIVDLEGKAVIPGLVDAHTHLLWAGDRSNEISLKQSGLSYSDISKMGGGIGHTVNQTRAASDAELIELGLSRMSEALRQGTTHMEVKSGYGLSTESELRLLEIADAISGHEALPSLDLTWLGAHAAPKGETIDSYTEEILSEQLPAVIEQGLARSADVFCEPGWFSLENTEDILKASRKGGLSLRLHIDEFSDGAGGELAAEMSVVTADHAHYTSNSNRQLMSDNQVMTGFLPGTPYSMGEDYPPFKQCLDNDWAWTIASDFNPNCRTLSLPFLGSLLVQRNEISPITALAACTVNSASTTPHPSGLGHGSIEVGNIANLNIVNGKHWEGWCLQPGISPFSATMINGQMIYH